jgi:hypothetical protein
MATVKFHLGQSSGFGSRSIANRALTIIWDAELDAAQVLPDHWIHAWQQGGEQLRWLTSDHRLPTKKGSQCNVLRLATGADGLRPVARFVTKPTALLVDALQSIGDFGQHREDFPGSVITAGYAASIVMMVLELVESLARDLARDTSAGKTTGD